MVDNFEYLSGLFSELVDENDFYFIQIIQRKKDGVELPSYTSKKRVIKSFYFFNKEEFLKHESYIKNLCENNNAQAYFWTNPRNMFDIACESIKQFSELIKNGNTRYGASVYDKVVGSNISSHNPKQWLVDLDSKDEEYKNKIISLIKECRGEEVRIKHIIPTISGYHLITSKFDLKQFSQKLVINNLDYVNIHTNSPTLLYANI